MELRFEDGVLNEGIGTGPLPNRATEFAASSLLATIAFALFNVALGGGGSAMPWGLVLPAANANVVDAARLPEVTVAAAVYW